MAEIHDRNVFYWKFNYKTIITEEEKAEVDINELKENIKKLYNNK